MTRTKAWSVSAACALVALSAAARPAEAQSNAAIAEQLFLDGRALMTAGKVHEACGKFADSQRADPALGTLLHLAACHEKDHRPATAWSEFMDAAEQARNSGQHDREHFARTHAAVLEKALQKIVIDISPPVDGVDVKLDSQPLPAGIIGTEIPLDPGDHDLDVTAPGKKPWHRSGLNLGASTAVTHVAVALENDATPAPSNLSAAMPEASSAAPVAAAVVTPDEVPSHTGQGIKRIAGVGAAVTGVGLLVVAGFEESTSISRKHAEANYPLPLAASQRAEVADQSKTAQTYAIVFGAAGVVALGVGLYLALTAHGETAHGVATRGPALRVAPYAGPRGGGLVLQGSL
ncbi:MAG TPA: hypothetical protein VK762_09240 [Polyangiaceae bacterium]|nr:hypothetical protein [Polyangiaceae bacterium]